jgi:hypothetical protein
MQHDDDWMVPRRVQASRSEGPDRPRETQNLQVDPQLVRRRKLRKQSLSAQPNNTKAEEEPWLDFDRSVARGFPAFPDRLWTLGDAARWVIERTPRAVDGLSIDEEKLFEVLPEIHTALSTGDISAFAHTRNDPVPSELPAETWSVYELVVEEKSGLIRIFPLSSGSSDHEQHLLNVRIRREGVLQRWPAASSPDDTPVQPTTIGAENQCRRWLATMMRKAPTQPKPKTAVREEALRKFPGLAKRSFDRAWNSAVRETNAHKWRAPGRRS